MIDWLVSLWLSRCQHRPELVAQLSDDVHWCMRCGAIRVRMQDGTYPEYWTRTYLTWKPPAAP